MNRKKIITDIQITQSPTWVKETTLASDLLGPVMNKFLYRFPCFGMRHRWLLSIFIILRYMRSYDVIVSCSAKGSQLILLIRAIFKIKLPRQIILEFMLDEEETSMSWRMKNCYKKFIYSFLDTIVVSSSEEVKIYSKRLGISRDKIKFVPFHTNIVSPKMITKHEGYIFSAGKAGRDFGTLIEAVRGTDIEVVIISDEYHACGLNVPENVKLLINVSYNEYLKWLQNCWFVVVPLKKLVKSSGQVVILEAMGLGKPVIATETTGTRDYIKHESTGILIQLNNPAELKFYIEKLMSDKGFFKKIAGNGLESVKKHNTFEAYVSTILNIAKSL